MKWRLVVIVLLVAFLAVWMCAAWHSPNQEAIDGARRTFGMSILFGILLGLIFGD